MARVYKNKMTVAITSIQLKSPFKIFAYLVISLNVMAQLKSYNCLEIKKKSTLTKHCTMTVWRHQNDLEKFVRSEVHMYAISIAKGLIREIRTHRFEAYTMPRWGEAAILLKTHGKSHFFE